MMTFNVTINDGVHVLSHTIRTGDGDDLPRLVAQAVQQTINPGPARLSVWHGASRPGMWWDYDVDIVPQAGASRTLSAHVSVAHPVPQAS
ncbi:hypothetical protein [Sulfobacillus harzensis]|uniref:Uncharacterized protein n=1 Tax=Sulfobacillus harzensis TaxID=2729629 RepID=A0A7Y0Q3Q3_9FIRM|nr:hypothetical protein [Sulfobacillus harzensis]NMP24513.1 hypothetical protein [Sulfobacillus harzensis]